MTERVEPEAGQVWRDRDSRRSNRLVRVLAGMKFEDSTFVHIETVRTAHGHAPVRPIRTRVGRRLWHQRFEFVGIG